MRNEPFGQQVEGLSHFRDQGCAFHAEVQYDRFGDLPFRADVGGKPPRRQGLREFKTLHRDRFGFVDTLWDESGALFSEHFPSFLIQTGPIAQPPRITVEPDDVAVTAGSTAVMSVAADGVGLVYRWQRAAGSGAFADVAGADAASLSVAGAALSDDGARFRCLISDDAGAVVSRAATLSVHAGTGTTTAGTTTGGTTTGGTTTGTTTGGTTAGTTASGTSTAGGATGGSTGVGHHGCGAGATLAAIGAAIALSARALGGGRHRR